MNKKQLLKIGSLIFLFGFLKSDDEKIDDSFVFKNKCPFCDNQMSIVEKTDGLGLYRFCSNCEVEFREYKDKVSIESTPEHTKISELYKYDEFPWSVWYKIGRGEYTSKEKQEFSELIKIEDTHELCPVCEERYLEKYEKKGFLSFNSVICPSCNTRFEIVYEVPDFDQSEVGFIYSGYINNILWHYFGKHMPMGEFKKILYSARQNIEDDTENELEKRDNISNENNNFKPIDFNNASESDLLHIQSLNNINIRKLVRLRRLGKTFSSYDELNEILNLSSEELNRIKEEILIKSTEISPNLNTQNNDSKNQIVDDENKIIAEIDKVDLNTASLNELKELPTMNLIKAKKIIQLRDEGNYIISYEDLAIKLSLNSKQIDQIKEVTIISEVDESQGRVIDF